MRKKCLFHKGCPLFTGCKMASDVSLSLSLFLLGLQIKVHPAHQMVINNSSHWKRVTVSVDFGVEVTDTHLITRQQYTLGVRTQVLDHLRRSSEFAGLICPHIHIHSHVEHMKHTKEERAKELSLPLVSFFIRLLRI